MPGYLAGGATRAPWLLSWWSHQGALVTKLVEPPGRPGYLVGGATRAPWWLHQARYNHVDQPHCYPGYLRFQIVERKLSQTLITDMEESLTIKAGRANSC